MKFITAALVSLFLSSSSAVAVSSPHIARHLHAKRCRAPSSSSSSSSAAAASSSSVDVSVSVSAAANIATTSSSVWSSSSTWVPETTSSSTWEAAPTTTSWTSEAAPTTSSTPTTTEQAVTTTSSTAAAATSSSSDSSESYLTGTQSGQGVSLCSLTVVLADAASLGTYYATGLGSCGITNTDTDYIAAVSYLLFDSYPGYDGTNPNNNPVCNKKITATYQGKSVDITVTDRCTGCALTDLDFSPSAFDQLADESVGRISGMTWVWAS
ncbi:uncharacterized protein STEHIDRAFT_46059 [Stereum hirsutum FP-91666 SS1]|uniref:uncharacterized protein n=1 Tax=Stereum hirsutum (strain FP-91666) TaxID=721885 RepID=UPI000440A9A1|nr:uncharacterized protein STEHIDRAFT_46059 [Stereum hirsutum FP-91666 SS1]EIM92959.1 hypothetical protein STEHIDRAFT_46059 [Stereum hirsutum FP-91666 SS1]